MEYQGHGQSGGVCLHSQGAFYPAVIYCVECEGHPACKPGKTYAWRFTLNGEVSEIGTYEEIVAQVEVALGLTGGVQ